MEINKEEKAEKMQKKKRRLIVLFCILGILLMLVIGFFTGKIIYNVMDEKGELENVDVNKLLSKDEIQGEDENIMNVTLETPTQTPEPTVEPTPTPNTTNTKDNKKEISYYIKINNEANVVTVYKKDSTRKLYCTIQSICMFYRRCNS